jgi:hypothetical protein
MLGLCNCRNERRKIPVAWKLISWEGRSDSTPLLVSYAVYTDGTPRAGKGSQTRVVFTFPQKSPAPWVFFTGCQSIWQVVPPSTTPAMGVVVEAAPELLASLCRKLKGKEPDHLKKAHLWKQFNCQEKRLVTLEVCKTLQTRRCALGKFRFFGNKPKLSKASCRKFKNIWTWTKKQ